MSEFKPALSRFLFGKRLNSNAFLGCFFADTQSDHHCNGCIKYKKAFNLKYSKDLLPYRQQNL